MRSTLSLSLVVILAVPLCSCGGTGGADGGGGGPAPPPEDRKALLDAVTTWACQLQGLERAGAVNALAASAYEMLVLEPTRTVQGSEQFDTAGMVARLKALPDGGRRLVLAYVDIGQAEDYRTYWQPEWTPPTLEGPGDPDFMVSVDPDGWEGNYPVAYWDPDWQQIIFGGAGSVVQAVLDDGFDGIYMDWVGGCEEDAVVARAARDGVDPAEEMIRFIRRLRHAARQRDDQFLLIAQSPVDLDRTLKGIQRLGPLALSEQDLTQVVERTANVTPVTLVVEDRQNVVVLSFRSNPLSQVSPQQTAHHSGAGLGQPIKGLAGQKSPQTMASAHLPGLTGGFELLKPGPQPGFSVTICQTQVQILQQEIQLRCLVVHLSTDLLLRGRVWLRLFHRAHRKCHRFAQSCDTISASSFSIQASRSLSPNSCASARASRRQRRAAARSPRSWCR